MSFVRSLCVYCGSSSRGAASHRAAAQELGAELARRRAALEKQGGFPYPASQTPWQEIQRAMVDQLADGMVLKPAVKYQRVAQKFVPRDNH